MGVSSQGVTSTVGDFRKILIISLWAVETLQFWYQKGGDFTYHISTNSCRDNYSFFGLRVQQLFKGDNYSKEETIN